MGKCKKQTKASANKERKERILKFILENRTSKVADTPPTPVKKSAKVPITPSPKKTDLSSCLITTPSKEPRLAAGENNPAVRKPPIKVPRTDSECQFHAPGPKFLTKRNSNVAEQVLVLKPPKPIRKQLRNKCDFFPIKKDDSAPFKDQITQTLYRESSAQTLTYLPDYAAEPNVRELFKLPSIVSADKPPGLYEVEILERSRKRWSFYDAVQLNRKRFQVSETDIRFENYRTTIEAFEWEKWIEREEYIQECQMMRLQILIKMFDKREREMHAASKTRIEQACERIEKRRQEALHKNEIAYQRGVRRLNTKMQRKWKKETPQQALGLPCSNFYGPQIRFGVDPARRHFSSTTGQRTFDLRMDELEQQVIARSLKCPFSKLKTFSRPKPTLVEAERNLCNEDNLQGIYTSLKYLRQAGELERTAPKCVKVKFRYTGDERKSFYDYNTLYPTFYERGAVEETVKHKPSYPKTYVLEEQPNVIVGDLATEDLQNVINSYEATSIGRLMQFLWEESVRLHQQRILHLISLLAQKERWHREAAESGLRQRENNLRLLYEELYQNSVRISNDVTDQYISSILTDDVDCLAGLDASETVTEMAKQIDVDINRWLESFKLIQNPLTYIPLRVMLRDMVSPDLEAVLRRHEKNLIAQYIVEDVIFERVWKELEPFDVSTALTSDFIDRLIDNDLYLFSTESETESESPRKTSWYEAHAIIRKLIRQSVPGRRWKEETERIVYENYNDMLDEIFAEILYNEENPEPMDSSDLPAVFSQRNRNLSQFMDTGIQDIPSNLFYSRSSRQVTTQVLNLIKKKNRLSSLQQAANPYDQTRYVVMETYKYTPDVPSTSISSDQYDGIISPLIDAILPPLSSASD